MADIPSENITVTEPKTDSKKKRKGKNSTMQFVENPDDKYIKDIKVISVHAPSPFIRHNYLLASEQERKDLSLLRGLEEEKEKVEPTPRFGEMMYNALAYKHRQVLEPPTTQVPKTQWIQNGLQNVPKNKEYSAHTDEYDDSLIFYLQERAKAEKLKPKERELTMKEKERIFAENVNKRYEHI